MPLTTYTAGEVLTASSLNSNLTVAGGLQFIKKQTIGTAVSTVTVTSAFSATYDSYRIVINGGVSSANTDIALRLGATATGYYISRIGCSYPAATLFNNAGANVSSFNVSGTSNTNVISLNVDLLNPFSADETLIMGGFIDPTVTGNAGSIAGYLNNQTSYTDFTLFPGTGTLTGGTISVYGYSKG
jgi:hypothetical protein